MAHTSGRSMKQREEIDSVKHVYAMDTQWHIFISLNKAHQKSLRGAAICGASRP